MNIHADLYLNELSIFGIATLYRLRFDMEADLSVIPDGEIWAFKILNPVHIRRVWDGKIEKKEQPSIGDFGFNNKREMFVYLKKGTWRSIMPNSSDIIIPEHRP